MTYEETKSSILAQLYQQALATAVDQLAKLAVENSELKATAAKLPELQNALTLAEAKNAALEARITEIVKRQDGPLPV